MADYPAPREVDITSTLETSDVLLRPPMPSDYDYLLSLFADSRITVGWRLRGATLPPDQFAQLLWQGVLTQFMVVRPKSTQRVGLVSAYNADLRNGCVWLSAIFAPEYEGRGWPFQAVVLVVDYLFRVWDIRRIYFEMLEFNFAKIQSGLGRWFDVEGCLRDYEYFDGRYWNKYFLAIHREKWSMRR